MKKINEELFFSSFSLEETKLIAKEIWDLNEEQRFNFILTFFNNSLDFESHKKGLFIASKSSLKKKHLMELFSIGMEIADASRIENWIKFLLPLLKFDDFLSFLKGKIKENPRQVSKVIYWLPSLIEKKDSDYSSKIESIKEISQLIKKI